MAGDEMRPCLECQGTGWFKCEEYLGLDEEGDGVWERWLEPCNICNDEGKRIPRPDEEW